MYTCLGGCLFLFKTKHTAPTGNRTQGKCLEGIYVTTTPLVPAIVRPQCILEIRLRLKIFNPPTIITPPPTFPYFLSTS